MLAPVLGAALGLSAGLVPAAAQDFFFFGRPEQPTYRQEAPAPAPRQSRQPSSRYGYQAQPPRAYQPQPGYGGSPYGGGYAPAPPPTEFRWPWERPAVRAPAPRAPSYARRPTEEPGRRSIEEPAREVRKRRPPRAAPAVVREQPVIKPKLATATVVAVFGDQLADVVAQGLEESVEDDRDMAVLRKTKADSGLARGDAAEWPKTVDEFLRANPKTAYAVFLLGANDSQPIKDGEQTVEPLSDRWREIYRDRVDAVLKTLTDKNVPVVWVGAPPVRNERLSNELSTLNDIYRDRVQRVGGVYVDIWPAFADDKNRYAAVGPDVEGQTARLRSNDGISFTKAGGRKAAHFASVEIKRLLEAKRGGAPATPPAAATPTPAEPAVAGRSPDAPAPQAPEGGEADRQIAALPAPAEPVVPQRPLAGPVVPLTKTDVSPGAKLLGSGPKLEGDAAQSADKAFRSGIAAPPQRGRADDYKWPPS
jgi:hypothetical protein